MLLCNNRAYVALRLPHPGACTHCRMGTVLGSMLVVLVGWHGKQQARCRWGKTLTLQICNKQHNKWMERQHCEQHGGHTCGCHSAATANQSLDEVSFTRSACYHAMHGNIDKLKHLIDRRPQCVHEDGAQGALRWWLPGTLCLAS